jgi:uncharacterized membrane protein YesL
MGKLFDLDSPVMTFLSKMADLIILNFVTIICCLPVITIGASVTAMHYVSLKIVRNEECYIVRAFFKSFKQNFKQATIMWLIMLAFIVIYILDFCVLRFSTVVLPDWVRILLLAVGVVAAFATKHAFPLLAKFENTIGKTFKNSLLVGVMILPKTVLMLVMSVVPLAIAIYFPAAMPVVIMFGVSGPALFNAWLYNKTFKKFEPAEEEIVSDEEWSIAVDESENPAEEEGEALQEEVLSEEALPEEDSAESAE